MGSIVSNYHTHTRYCDGQGEMQSYVEEAIRQGLTSLGFSAHQPLPFATHSNMRLESLPLYLAEAHQLQERYAAQIAIYVGLELDYLPCLDEFQRQYIYSLALDYRIGSVHLIGGEDCDVKWTIDGPCDIFDRGARQCYGGDFQRMVREYYRRVRAMVQAGGIDIVGHLDRIIFNNVGSHYFSDSAAWYRDEVEETLHTIATYGPLIELNVSSWYAPIGQPNPSPWVLKRCRELGIRVTVSSDAHCPEFVARGLDRATQLLESTGYTEIWQLNTGQWTPYRLNAL